MADYTDLEIAKMEKEIHHTYTKAQKELQEKWDKYMAKAQPKVDKAQAAYIQAVADGNPVKAAKAKEAYEKAALNMTLQNEHYQAMVNQVTDKLADTNQIALDYINGQMPKIYCHSYNEFGEQKIKGYSFELVNEDTVKNLIKDGNKSLLPQKQLNIPKDKLWNTKNINSQVLQGILQGENSYKIAKRLTNVTDMNYKSALRNARTMTTSAYNKGRQDSFERATNDGVLMKRRWVVAHDNRLRDWHAELDGVETEVDEPWVNSYGEIMYPGDPAAHPSNVYNCRCSIRAVINGFKPVEKTKGSYADQYQGTGVTAQYYSMLDEDKALGNEFWKALKAEGKPSAVWNDYLTGNTSKEATTKIDDILAKYKGTGQPIKPGKAKKAPVVAPEAPKPDLKIYQDKSMTATFYSVKAENKELGKEFWAILQAEENPSVAWSQYLIGTAPKEMTEKLDKVLLQHKGTGAWTKPVSAKKAAAQAADDLYDKMKASLPQISNMDKETLTEVLDTIASKGVTGVAGPANYYKDWLKGKINDPDLDALFGLTSKTATAAEKAATKKAANEIAKAQAKMAAAQGNLDSLGNKMYSGIWKDPVNLSDYEVKAASITAKKQWYYDQIEDLTHKIDAGDIAESIANAKITQYEKYIDDLIEFENQGKLYAQYAKEYQEAFEAYKKLQPVSEAFGPDLYTAEHKAMALWARNDAEYRTLDKYYDKVAKKIHDARTAQEYEGYYHYTWGSGPFNQPLAGFKGSWSPSAFVGPNKMDIDYGGYGDKIRGLTSLCEKSKYDKPFWVQTGQNRETLEGFLGIPYGSLGSMTEQELQQFLGVEKELPQFISGAINKGGGTYTPGNMLFNIYCPEGSEALYVRQDGRFGKAEHEMILQRGGTYKITKIYWGTDKVHGGKKLIVDLELHPEKGYNKFQQKK